jgi:hypothetical protein
MPTYHQNDAKATVAAQVSEEVFLIVQDIRPILAGRAPQVQGAVLAELLSLWLASHWLPGEKDRTEELRASLLTTYCALVRKLTEINAKRLGTDT